MASINDVFGPEDTLAENDSTATTTSSVFKKRSRDSPMEEDIFREQTPKKTRRPHRYSPRRQSSCSLDETNTFPAMSTPSNESDKSYTTGRAHHINSESLTDAQQDFVRHWYERLAQLESIPILSYETLSALATLTQTRPQLVLDYVKETYPSISDTACSSTVSRNEVLNRQSHTISSTPQVLATATNEHLHPQTLALIQKYLQTCRRTRPRTDGRRSVNSGPYCCTFGCNYTTRRVFDWRRHEETHEPQELWLCTLCTANSNGTDNAFLVGRKDKFLKHAREVHGQWKAEKVLEMSRVDWRRGGDGDPVEKWTCGKSGCEWEGREWDERCRHVLGHFDDEVAEERKGSRRIGREKAGKGFDEDEHTALETIANDDERSKRLGRGTVSPIKDR
jgi:hypothetical protein